MIATWGHALARFLLPNACVVCSQPGNPDAQHDALLCALCRNRLTSVIPGCTRCSQPLPPVGPCRFCAEWDGLETVRSAVWLGDGARQAVHALKYGGVRAMAEPLADVAAHRLAAMRGVLVPIPLGDRRLRTRGYNQAAELAHALGRRWRLPVRPESLVRQRETQTQTELAPEARRANVEGAFLPANRGHGTVILVDDVLTTGATLLAAAQALRSAGWGPVQAVTFARAEPWGRRIAS